MKVLRIQRKTKIEKRFTPQMGQLFTPVTYIRKTLLGIPIETLYKYRQTYYGEIKDCRECLLHV
ncbi:hypothetical protein [Robiginitalea aurantiaca]|uniref:Transposase n=1 Tax=Robiginitalea aurantiaca TaxID=3056915 RepID=A0ABT7WC21_9FLAO|nr:hypothetical protein [Robiginitalea aurantiaca]MDM9630462.1 hypothetical protein [Robiginitalea aurantiaca]